MRGYLRRVSPAREDHVVHGAEAARKALEMMGPLRSRLKMAEGWCKTLKRTHQYFSRLRTAWFDNAPRMMQGLEREIWNEQSIATAQLHPPDAESTRVLWERVLRGLDGGEDDDDDDTDMAEVSQVKGVPVLPAESAHPSTSDRHAQQEERWNAINSVAAAASALSAASSNQGVTAVAPAASNSGHFRFLSSYGTSSGSSPALSPYPQHSFRPADGAAPPVAGNGSSTGTSWTTANGSSVLTEPLPGIHHFATAASPGHARSSSTPGLVQFSSTSSAGYGGSAQERTNDREIRDLETWLSSVERGFGADDLAAFVDGIEIVEGARGLVRVGKGGWVGVVWGV